MANEEQMSIDQLATEALKLSAEEREQLAMTILSSIDDELEFESEWAAEADRRAREIREGRVDTIPGDTVLGEALDRLK